ncbi:MAG TPA: cation:proton antiporter [Gemmataceae bacterium]|jgi:Kef-type K+ transport system membrane component KefB
MILRTIRHLRPTGAYALMLAAAVGAFLLVRTYGETLPPPPAEPSAAAGPATARPADTLARLLLALGVVVAAGRGLGAAFARLRQPPVIGEVVAGILLGPSLLGRIAPSAQEALFPAEVVPLLAAVAQLGVILYMFLVGVELDAGSLGGRAHAAVAVSHAGIVVPFVLGAVLALGLYPSLAGPGVPFTPFALFLGVSLSVTAFPVLARILTDRGLSRTRLGAVALTCAAADDVTAWCLLAFVTGVARAAVGGAVLAAALTAAYAGFVAVAVRPLAERLAARCEGRPCPRGALAAVLVALLASALATEAIGVHALFGAFLLGCVIPHGSGLARALTRRLEDVVTVLLLPAFFALTGLRTQVGLVSGAGAWLVCGLIVLVATAGKAGGAAVAARVTGLGWRDSAALGVLMNTRGLMELIVLTVGLDLGILSPTLFAMLVLMAVATTLATTPILDRLAPASLLARPADARPARRVRWPRPRVVRHG